MVNFKSSGISLWLHRTWIFSHLVAKSLTMQTFGRTPWQMCLMWMLLNIVQKIIAIHNLHMKVKYFVYNSHGCLSNLSTYYLSILARGGICMSSIITFFTEDLQIDSCLTRVLPCSQEESTTDFHQWLSSSFIQLSPAQILHLSSHSW